MNSILQKNDISEISIALVQKLVQMRTINNSLEIRNAELLEIRQKFKKQIEHLDDELDQYDLGNGLDY